MSSDNNQGLIEIWEKADLYFKEALERAKDHQRVGLSDLATHYLMVILLGVMRDYDAYRRVMSGGSETVAQLFGSALSGEFRGKSRSEAFRSIGDSALIISGIWWQSLWRSLVDVDYYMYIGAASYQEAGQSGSSLSGVFDELANKFVELVKVLSEATEQISSNADIMRMYETWVLTHNRLLEKRLRALGINPISLRIGVQ